ncbi:MAG: hypothetical protein LDL33_00630 [Desulfomonile sp.]|nr:hypothetical protein [Desulfomonile sp.]
MGISGDKQIGTSTRPKSKIGLDTIDVGGVKQLGTGSGSQQKSKDKVDTGVSGAKQLGEGWSSPATTSGGTIQMQRSGRGKKQ